MDSEHRLTDKRLEAMERHLSKIYKTAYKDLSRKAENYFDKFQKLDNEMAKMLKDGEITLEEYQTWRKKKIMQGQHWRNLVDKTSKDLANVNKIALAYINGELPDVYVINYNGVNQNIGNTVKGYSFELVDAETVKFLSETNESLLPYKDLDIPKDLKWNTKRMNSEVLQGILQGESMNKIAARLASVALMNMDAAIRNARTMVTGAENRGRMEGFKKAEASGIILKKKWLSSNDRNTRDAHLPGKFDSLVVDVDKPFSNSIGLIMYPGDPSADPSNVYNCRCTLGNEILGFKKVK